MTATSGAICPYCKANLAELDFSWPQARYHIWLCSQDDGLKRLSKLVTTIEAEKKVTEAADAETT